jgi:fucokinase
MEVIARLMTETFVSIWNTTRLSKNNVPAGGLLLSNNILSSSRVTNNPIYDCWVIATAPVRIDLAGGWTDTPPICYELGSAVIGVAVALDGMYPLSARCRIVREQKGIFVKSEMRDFTTGMIVNEYQSEIQSLSDFNNYRDPSTNCALLKCVLVQLGLLSMSSNDDKPLQHSINQFCSTDINNNINFRLELISTSLLPQGSGLGTSSILAGCLVAAVARCIGILDDSNSPSQERFLINEVLQVEQLLTTGGGYQDQVNGIIGGIKYSQTKPFTTSSLDGTLRTEEKIEIERVILDPKSSNKLEQSFVLVFTGQTRLAKNLLVNVLRRWSKRTPEICQTTAKLMTGASRCCDCVKETDLDGIGVCLSDYWALKKIMAGSESGVEPESIRTIIDIFQNKLMATRGASLCGAGGGGFLVLMTKDGLRSNDMKDMLEHHINTSTSSNGETLLINTDEFIWYNTTICDQGLSLRVLDDCTTDGKDSSYFDMSWLRVVS